LATIFLELLGGLAAGKDAVYDDRSAALPDLPEIRVEGAAVEAVSVDELGGCEEFGLVIAREDGGSGDQAEGKEAGGAFSCEAV